MRYKLPSRLRGGRTPWQGENAYQGQMGEYERRRDIDELQQAFSSRGVSTTPKTLAGEGYNIVTNSSTIALPSRAALPVIIKNATGAPLTVSTTDERTIFADVSGYSSIVLAAGDAVQLTFYQKTWYVV